ncbi:Lrp/AsnC family transcriptional regulator [Enterococcus wangshanyuanii]|uniref:Transcriptional regulator n=1 Tax=Enterococcus wangshanyuanii TaxID=2005703 RepID=A0ABQ1P6X2_9ENTE|nr:winged helix-turn-helix transcriptional regulator [Enterococcus wangshanyuanii]GGC91832.1 transcriptional regulator [Enterococcus wangshanyuanii]
MDIIDKQILTILTQNSKLTNKEIGEMIHMTGQAVSARILNLQKNGLIKKYSIEINHSHTQFIRVFMDSNNFDAFEQFVNTYEEVSSIYKVSGQACYMIIGHFEESNLAPFIEKVSKWARYSVETVISDRTTDTLDISINGYSNNE